MTLNQLDIVHEDRVLCSQEDNLRVARVYLKPTNPSCHLVQQIALSIYCKLEENLLDFESLKLELLLEEDSHSDIGGVQKQINDKERVCAALENEDIRKFIDKLINYE